MGLIWLLFKCQVLGSGFSKAASFAEIWSERLKKCLILAGNWGEFFNILRLGPCFVFLFQTKIGPWFYFLIGASAGFNFSLT